MIEEAGALGLAGAREQGVWIRFNLDPGYALVLVDRVQIQQVLRELIASSRPVDDDLIEVSMSDTGHGFADDVEKNLFQTFFTTKESGMGVGLSISRSIIEAHGGSMWAESNQAGGATFRFTLPAASNESLIDGA
jgi:two-component system sensor kinase FixL